MNTQGLEQQQFNTEKNDIFSVDNNSVPMNNNNSKFQNTNELSEKSKKSNISLLKQEKQPEYDYIDEIQDVKMSVVINRKLYTYIGKPHPEIMQLFELLKEKAVQKSNFRIINYSRQKWEDLETFFDTKCVFFGGRMKISVYEAIIYLFFTIIYIVYAVKMASLSDDITVKSSQWKSQLSGNSVWFGAIFTVYGIIYINIKSVLILFLLFLALVIVQLLLLLNDFNILTNGVSDFSMVSYSTLYSRIYPMILYLHWFIFSLIYNWIKNSFKRSSSMFFAVGWCLLIPYFACLEVMQYLLLQQNYQVFDAISSILNILLAPMIIIIIVSWIILHYRLFMLPVSNITIAIARIKEEIKNNFKQPIPIEEDDNDEEDPQKKKLRSKWMIFKKFLRVNFYLISSFVIGGIYCFCEIFLIYQVINQFYATTMNYDNLAILLFQIIIIPAFVILGIVISVSKRQTWATFTFFPLFVAAFPLFAIIPLSSLLTKTSFGGNITYVAIIALPTCIIYWLILAIFGVQRRFQFLFFITYTCIFFAFPIGFLLPLSYIEITGFDASTVYLACGAIVGGGVALIILYFMFFIIKFFYQKFYKRSYKEVINLTALSYFNLKNMGFLVNSSGFILGYTLLCYVFYSRPSTASNDDRGFVDGMLINLPLIFVLVNYALQTESLEFIVEEDNFSLDQSMNQSLSQSQSQVSKSQISQNSEYQEVQSKQTFQKRLIYVGIIVPFVTCLPIFILSSQRQNTTRTAVIMIGMPCCFLLLWFLLEVKNRSKKLQNFFTPFLATICWCCVILPLLVIAPVAANYIETEGAYFADFMRSIIAAVAIILICGVTSFSIFIFVIKNRLEEEKKKKFVVTQMLKMCIDNRVKAQVNPLAILYDYFHKIFQQEDRMKLLLQDNFKPLRYNVKRPQKNKNFEEEIIVTKQNKKSQKEEKKRSKLDICLDYLFCRFGIQVESLNQEEDSEITTDEIIREVERAEQIMDDYLPKQIKMGYIYGQSNQNDLKVNLMENIEQTKQQKAVQLFENKNLKVSSKHEQLSSKTNIFRSYKLKKIKPSDLNKFKFTDYSQLIYNSEFERGLFFHDLYKDFANEDDYQPEAMIYNDFLELSRLSGIMQVDDDYASSLRSQVPSLQEKQDSIPSDLQSFDDFYLEQLTQKELSQIYDKYASQFWKGGILALSLSDFSKCMIDIANKLSISKESINVSLKLRELLYERMFGYLMINIPSFASNYRPDVRKFMKKEEIEKRMEGSPFYFTIPLKAKVEDDEEIIFNYQKKNKFLLSMQKEENLTYENIQRLNINQEKQEAKNQTKVQDQNQKQPQKPKENITFFIMMCRCLRTCCCVYPSKAFSYVDKKITALIQKLTKPKISNNVTQRKPLVKKAPNWTDMADNLVTTMVISIKAYEENQKQAQNVQFNLNINNIVIVVGKLSDFLTLYGVAFNNQVEWFPGYTTKVDTAQVTSGTIFTGFQGIFWLSVGLAICYFFLALIAQGHAEKGTLGKDEHGDNATYTHKQFYLSKGVNLLGSSLFMFIMKTLIDTYICDWSSSSPWKLYRSSSIECLSNIHFWMMAIGFIALLGYYPLSTFIQPGIQFLDNTLDVKYDKSYIAVYIQAKLIVLGATAFFNSFDNKSLISMVQLSVTSFVGFGMSLIAIKIQPCLIGFINPIEIGCLLSIGIINGIGLLIVITDQSLILFVINIVLHLVVIIVVALILKKKYFNNKKQQKKLVLSHLPVIKKTQDKIKEREQFKAVEEIPQQTPQQTPQNSKRQNKITSKDVSESFQIQQRLKNQNILEGLSDDANSKAIEEIQI